MSAFDEALDEAELNYIDVQVCLKGPLRREWEALTEAITELQEQERLAKDEPAADARMSAKSETAKVREDLQAQMEALRPKVLKATVTIRITAMTFAEWNSLVLEYPPRDGNMVDRTYGFNTLEFYPAAMRASGQKVEDDGVSDITPEQWARLEAQFTDAVMDDFARAVNTLNRREGAGVPF